MMQAFKKQIICAIFVSLIFVCSTQLIDVSMGEELAQGKQQTSDAALLWDAFAVTGAKLSGLEINGWVMLPQAMDESQIRQELGRLGASLSVDNSKLSENVETYPGFYSLKLSGELMKDTWLEIGVQSLNFSDQDVCNPETYITVNYCAQNPTKESIAWEARIKTSLQSLGYKPNITTCYSGIINGRMNRVETDKLTTAVFAELKAKQIEGVNNENLLSMAGYSPLLQNEIQVGARNINLNLALRYDATYRQTHVIIASPLISTEY